MSVVKAIILAAGAGTRMKSNQPKVIHKVLDKTMLDYVIDAAKEAGAEEICIVVGHGKEEVIASVKEPVSFVTQEQQLGTGHAVMQAIDFIGDEGKVFVLFGDTPLITGASLSKLSEYHEMNQHKVTVLSAAIQQPDGYGRIVRDQDGSFVYSIEHKDANTEERKIKEINSGMYVYDAAILKESLGELSNDNAAGEYYLPDTLISIMKKGYKVEAMMIHDYEEILGVNSKVQLYEATNIMKHRINYAHMEAGVCLMDAGNTYIGKDVVIGKDVTILPGCLLEGKTTIGDRAKIGPNTRIYNSIIGEGSSIEQSTILESRIGEESSVGPYAYIRPGSQIGDHVKIGDFVEIKNSTIGNGTKVSHLTYVGDADVGVGVNFGCGTVTVNYDGKKKYRTTIKDHAFIGCNTNLVSPVTVGENAYTAAGSTITKDVPENSLAIARVRQENKQDWVSKRFE